MALTEYDKWQAKEARLRVWEDVANRGVTAADRARGRRNARRIERELWSEKAP